MLLAQMVKIMIVKRVILQALCHSKEYINHFYMASFRRSILKQTWWKSKKRKGDVWKYKQGLRTQTKLQTIKIQLEAG